jgi:uncharacterized protein involved in exopolysaccharide biosynthesis
MNISAKELVGLGFKNWKLMAVFILTFGLIGIIFSILRPVKYESELTFVVENKSMIPAAGLAGIASSLGFGGGLSDDGIFDGENLIELFRSRRIVEGALLDKIPYCNENFINEFAQSEGFLESWKSDPQLALVNFKVGKKRNSFTNVEDSLVMEIQKMIKEKNLTVKQISNKVSIIKIKFESKSSLMSRYFPEALLKRTEEFYRLSKTEKARVSFNILKLQVDSVRSELNSGIDRIAGINDELYGINPAMQRHRSTSTKTQIDVQANTVILTELVKNMEIARMNLLDQTPLIQVIDRPSLPLEEKKFRKLYGLILGGMFGAVLGLGFLIIKNQRKVSLEIKE